MSFVKSIGVPAWVRLALLYKKLSQSSPFSHDNTHYPPHKCQHHALRMTNIDATTPQLKALKQVADAISSGNVQTIEPLLSKDYKFRTFPKKAELPDLAKEEYLQKFGVAFGAFAKIEVCIQHLGISFEFAC